MLSEASLYWERYERIRIKDDNTTHSNTLICAARHCVSILVKLRSIPKGENTIEIGCLGMNEKISWGTVYLVLPKFHRASSSNAYQLLN